MDSHLERQNLTPSRGPSVWKQSGWDGSAEHRAARAALAGAGLLLVGLACRPGARHGVLLGLSGAALFACAAEPHLWNGLSGWAGRLRARRNDIVTEASEESFPASDSPSWTPVTGSWSHQEG